MALDDNELQQEWLSQNTIQADRLDQMSHLVNGGFPALSSQLSRIASTLSSQVDQSGKNMALDRAIAHQLEAVRLTHETDPVYLSRLMAIGRLVMMRYDQLRDSRDLYQAVTPQLEALRLTAPDDPALAFRRSNVGVSLFKRFDRFRDTKDIDRAIIHQKEAVALTPSDNPDLPLWLHNLGNSLRLRFQQLREVEDIHSAITRQLEAVRLTPKGSRDLPSRLDSLGYSLRWRFMRLLKVVDIDLSITNHLEAVHLTTADDPDLSLRLNNLGGAFATRCWQSVHIDDSDHAVTHHLEAVRLTSEHHPDFAMRLSDLGLSLIYRFEQFGNIQDIDHAIMHQMEAVRVTHADHEDLPFWLNSLSSSLRARFDRFGHVDDIDRAIAYQLEAVRLTRSSGENPELAVRLDALSGHLCSRFEVSGDVTDINQSILHQQEALRLTAEDDPILSDRHASLGHSFIARSAYSENIEDLDQAKEFLRHAGTNIKALPTSRYLTLIKLSWILHEQSLFQEALPFYEQAISLLPLVMWVGLDAATKLSKFPYLIQRVPCHAAACAIQLAELLPEHKQIYLGKAVELLDQGRSILWSQASDLQNEWKELRDQHPWLANELDSHVDIIRQVTFGNSIPERDAQIFRRKAERYTEIVTLVQKVSKFQKLMRPKISDFQRATSDGHIVTINISPYRCDAIIIKHDSEIDLVSFPDVKQSHVVDLAKAFSKEIIGFEKRSPCLIDKHLHTVWASFGKPIVEHLYSTPLPSVSQQTLPRVWWCLTGAMTFIPIHACSPKPGRRGGNGLGMMDFVVSSYTPTISTLIRAQRIRTTGQNTVSFLAVAQANGPSGTSPLPNVAEEVDVLRHLHLPTIEYLIDEQAVLASVSDGLSRCTWAHFACHSSQHPKNSIDSAIELHDGKLTIGKIAQNVTNEAEFVYMSACQSAKGSDSNPHESIHIAAALQYAGFRSVVGSMWSVMDKDSPEIVKDFYSHLFLNNQSQPRAEDTARALHHAIQEFRKKSAVNSSRWVSFIHIGA